MERKEIRKWIQCGAIVERLKYLILSKEDLPKGQLKSHYVHWTKHKEWKK